MLSYLTVGIVYVAEKGAVILLCCAVLCCAVLCCAVLCCAVLCEGSTILHGCQAPFAYFFAFYPAAPGIAGAAIRPLERCEFPMIIGALSFEARHPGNLFVSLRIIPIFQLQIKRGFPGVRVKPLFLPRARFSARRG